MLTLVAPTAPSRKQAVLERIKKAHRIDGMLQCNRCGCRTAITAVSGAIVKNGRVQGGTVIAKYECAECWKRGIFSPMLRDLESVS